MIGTSIEITGLKLGIAAAILVGVAGSTWFAADAHYGKALAAQRQADKDAADAAHQIEIHDKYVTKEVNDEALRQLNALLADNSALGVRLAASRRVVAPIAMSCQPVRAPDGRGAPADASSAAADAGPASAVAVDADALDAALKIGIDEIDRELLYRAYERGTGHSPQPVLEP